MVWFFLFLDFFLSFLVLQFWLREDINRKKTFSAGWSSSTPPAFVLRYDKGNNADRTHWTGLARLTLLSRMTRPTKTKAGGVEDDQPAEMFLFSLLPHLNRQLLPSTKIFREGFKMPRYKDALKIFWRPVFVLLSLAVTALLFHQFNSQVFQSLGHSSVVFSF